MIHLEVNLERGILRWLEAERRGAPADAESWLARVLRRLPDVPPTPGFAVRVLAACGLEPARRPVQPAWLLWTGRVLESVALVGVAAGLLLFPALLQAVPGGLFTALMGAIGIKAVLGFGVLVSLAAQLWTGCVVLGAAVAALLHTPQGVSLVAILLAIGYSLTWSLTRLLPAPGRSSR